MSAIVKHSAAGAALAFLLSPALSSAETESGALLALARTLSKDERRACSARQVVVRLREVCAACGERAEADRVDAELAERCTAMLAVDSKPRGAEIFVDDVSRGRAPLSIRLEPGPHVVKAGAPGLPSAVEGVCVAPGTVVATLELGAGRAAAARARVLERSAFARFDQEEWCEGIAKLRAARALVPAPAYAFNLAVAYERWGRCADARAETERYLRECPSCDLAGAARAKLAEIDRSCAPEIEISARPPSARIRIDGADRGTPPVRVHVDPGVHVAEAIADGFEPAVTAWLAEARRGRTIDLALVPIEVAPPPRPQPTVEPLPRLESLQPLEPELTAVPPRVGPASDPEPKRGISGWAWVSAGIGVAALVTGGVFGVLAVNDRGEMDQLEADARAMPGVPFRDRIEEVADRGERNRSVAIAGLSAGAVAAAAGIVLFLLDGAP